MSIVIHGDRQPAGTQGKSASKPLLSERVYQQFKRDILTGVLEPGLALTEAFLTKRFGASLTPVREACIRLNSEKLLASVPNKGYSVASISMKTIHELFQIRAVLEGFTAEEACRQNNPELLAKIEALARINYKFGDRAGYLKFIDANYHFHLCIAQLAGNQRAVGMLSDIMNELARLSYLTVALEDEGSQIAQEHASIVRAICEKDAKNARKSILKHIRSAKQNILNIYSNPVVHPS